MKFSQIHNRRSALQAAEKGVDSPKSPHFSYLEDRSFFAKSGFFSTLLDGGEVGRCGVALF